MGRSNAIMLNAGSGDASTLHPRARRMSIAQSYETMDLGSELQLPPPPGHSALGQDVNDDPRVTVLNDSSM